MMKCLAIVGWFEPMLFSSAKIKIVQRFFGFCVFWIRSARINFSTGVLMLVFCR